MKPTSTHFSHSIFPAFHIHLSSTGVEILSDAAFPRSTQSSSGLSAEKLHRKTLRIARNVKRIVSRNEGDDTRRYVATEDGERNDGTFVANSYCRVAAGGEQFCTPHWIALFYDDLKTASSPSAAFSLENCHRRCMPYFLRFETAIRRISVLLMCISLLRAAIRKKRLLSYISV